VYYDITFCGRRLSFGLIETFDQRLQISPNACHA